VSEVSFKLGLGLKLKLERFAQHGDATVVDGTSAPSCFALSALDPITPHRPESDRGGAGQGRAERNRAEQNRAGRAEWRY
jgi:hypothetical protein